MENQAPLINAHTCEPRQRYCSNCGTSPYRSTLDTQPARENYRNVT